MNEETVEVGPVPACSYQEGAAPCPHPVWAAWIYPMQDTAWVLVRPPGEPRWRSQWQRVHNYVKVVYLCRAHCDYEKQMIAERARSRRRPIRLNATLVEGGEEAVRQAEITARTLTALVGMD